MKCFKFIPRQIRHSLALELLVTVFSAYLIVAVSVTIFHMVVTYNTTKSNVERNIDSVWNITKAGLSKAVWELDHKQVRAVLTGILESPHVIGMKLLDPQGKMVDALGVIQVGAEQYRNMSIDQGREPFYRTGLQLYAQQFPIQITEFSDFTVLGSMVVYSSNEVIFEEVKLELLLIVLNAIFKTIALWGLFLWGSGFILNRPLKRLTQAAHQVDMESLEAFELPQLKTRQNELGILGQAFIKMVDKLRVARDELKEANKVLEVKVEERTKRLNGSNQALTLQNEKLEQQHRQLQEAQTQLIQAEKMSGLGTLVAGVAHEINNPINFIHGNIKLIHQELANLFQFIVDMAGGDTADPDVVTAFKQRFNKIDLSVEDILEGSQRIIGIISDLRSFSRMDQGRVSDVNLLTGLASTLRMIQAKYKEKINFLTDFNSIPDIVCWPAKLNQVFMNIIINGCQAIVEQEDFTPGTGCIKVITRQVGEHISITISDNGVGMDPLTLEKMFDPFYSTKPVGQGTGLGMSISYGIIKSHKGTIEVDSQPGMGTTVVIILPIDFPNHPV